MTRSSVPPAPDDDDRRTRRGCRPVQRDVSTLGPVAVAVGASLLAYLGLAVACADPAPSSTGDDSCRDRVVYHAARLTDC